MNQKIDGIVPAADEDFYYDPAKYDTYLEQLGIKYPTVRATPGN